MSMNLERTNRRGFLKTAGGLAAAGAAGALGLTNADEPIYLAAFPTGRHAAQARTIQHFTVDNAAKIRKLYWESVLGRAQDTEQEHVITPAPSTGHGQPTIPAARSDPRLSNARFTTREMELLNTVALA
ncbi:twin-arginine translocation signal domain-containing protein [Nonomuraea sp. NPDC049400]|uniref:twin-arginine translocation signal domain-containing protein n=1 Tax=Nonomuraea sp. NPDC049400 TaxID=3364352 RepID=UPI0037A7D7D7